MSRYLLALTSLFVAPALAVASPAQAGEPAVSKSKATKAALTEVRGKVTSSKMETINGEPVYIFTIAAPNQPLQTVRVSATSGKVM